MDNFDHRIGAALRELAEQRDRNGEWPLDIFLNRHAGERARDLQAAAREIGICLASEQTCHKRVDEASFFAGTAAFIGVLILINNSHLTNFIFIILLLLAITMLGGLIARRHFLRKARDWFDRSQQLGETNFTPFGVLFASETQMVYRLSNFPLSNGPK